MYVYAKSLFIAAAILTYAFARSKTGFRKTDTVINRLIRGSIQTGLFVSIFALGDLFTFVLHGNTNLYAMFAYPIGRIYTNVRSNNSLYIQMQKPDNFRHV